MKRHILGAGIIFLILLIEDFLVGSIGHYTGSGADGNFLEYIFMIPPEHILIMLGAAIIIYLILTRSPIRGLIRA